MERCDPSWHRGIRTHTVCARCHHFLRTMPPSRSAEYAEGCRDAAATLLEGMTDEARQQEVAMQFASMSMRMGCLGIRSASRLAPSVFWASWAALPMLQDRLPSMSDQVAASNSHTGARSQWLRQPSRVARRAGGSTSSPSTWVRASRLPLPNTIFGRRLYLPNHAPPTRPSTFSFGSVIERRSVRLSQDPNSRFTPRCSGTMCERLRQPLQLTCECGAASDKCGRHRGPCPWSEG